MTTTGVRVNLQYELEDYNVFTKKKPVIVDMQRVRSGFMGSKQRDQLYHPVPCCSISSKKELSEMKKKAENIEITF